MTPREIISKHLMKIPGVRVRDVHKAVDAAMKEIAEYDWLILERADLPRGFSPPRASFDNRAMQNKDR